jgi:hypothetical protein
MNNQRSARTRNSGVAALSNIHSESPRRPNVPLHPLLKLQQTIGNRAVQRMIQSSSADTEQQGDARSMMPSVDDVVGAPGQALDPRTRAFFEPRFGSDFHQVSVHTGSRAEESAAAVNARAYTVGTHIVFGAGEYAPGNTAGQELLAHELAHVVQNAQGATEASTIDGARAVSLPSDPLEKAAEHTAARILEPGAKANAGRKSVPSGAVPGSPVQRQPTHLFQPELDKCYVPGKEPPSMRPNPLSISPQIPLQISPPYQGPSMGPDTRSKDEREQDEAKEKLRERLGEFWKDRRDDPGEIPEPPGVEFEAD